MDLRKPDLRKTTLLLCALLTTLTLIAPIGRLGRRTELSYNEGWNIAAAMRLSPGASSNPQLPLTTGTSPLPTACCQAQLYPAAWGWTTVNYPALSFVLLAALHHLTGEYLLTARVVSLFSLLACAALLGLVVRALGVSRYVATLTALLCTATLAVCAVDYAGVDDPQLFGDALFLLALFIYVRHRRTATVSDSVALSHSYSTEPSVPHVRNLGHEFRANKPAAEATYLTLALTAALFSVAGSVKQSPIDIPIAVFIDLLFLSRKKAAWFTVCGLVFGALALLVSRHIGGPWLVPQLLLGRLYSVAKARDVAISVLGPMLLPLLLAGYTAWQLRQDPRRRVAAILLVTSIAIGIYFGGGSGVAGNALFTALLAVTLLLGLSQSCPAEKEVVFRPKRSAAEKSAFLSRAANSPWLAFVPFLWLIVPALVQGVANPIATFRDTCDAEIRFTATANLLQQQPGPALCESILLCLQAGKPYIYDPFNSTRLLLQGKLSEPALLSDIAGHRFSAIQLHAPANQPDDLFRERFTPATLAAIQSHYSLVLQTPDMAIYLPAIKSERAGFSKALTDQPSPEQDARKCPGRRRRISQVIWGMSSRPSFHSDERDSR